MNKSINKTCFAVRLEMAETTALGAAMAAGFAEGIKVWDLDQLQPTSNVTFNPVITDEGY